MGPATIAVGIMGLGVMGSDSAMRLRDLGFKVAGWSRNRRRIEGVHCYAGDAEFDAFLHRTDILVSLLPHTAATNGIINRDTIRKLSRKGPFGAPIIINAGRGKQQVEGDILGFGCRRASCRDARCLRDRALAAGKPALDPSQGDANAALRGRFRP